MSLRFDRVAIASRVLFHSIPPRAPRRLFLRSEAPRPSPFSSPKSRSRSLSRPPRLTEHIPPLPYTDFSNLDDLRGPDDTYYVHSRADSGAESDSDDCRSPRFSPSAVTLTSTSLEALKSRLQPLRHVEQLLIARLVPPNEDEATHLGVSINDLQPFNHNQEIFVRPSAMWKGALSKARVTNPSDGCSENGRPNSTGYTGIETADEPQHVLYSCQRDMISLWYDEIVREILRKKKVRLEEVPGLLVGFAITHVVKLISLVF